jgi:RimJ/RimL family protein N-acetyltransferase
MEIIIREANLKDLDVLHKFKQALVDAERPFDSTLKTGPLYYYDIAGLIAADHVGIFVAETGSEIIGCGYARIDDSKPYLKHKQHAHLGFMYVVPHHRGKGINKMIIDALKLWSQQREIMEIRLEVYAKNVAALKAYEKAGFAAHMLTMRMNLDESQN